MQTAVQVRFVMVKMPAEQSPVSMSREAYQSACGSGFLPSIGSGLRTPCSRLLPYDLDALTRPRNRTREEFSSALRAFTAKQNSPPVRCSTALRP